MQPLLASLQELARQATEHHAAGAPCANALARLGELLYDQGVRAWEDLDGATADMLPGLEGEPVGVARAWAWLIDQASVEGERARSRSTKRAAPSAVARHSAGPVMRTMDGYNANQRQVRARGLPGGIGAAAIKPRRATALLADADAAGLDAARFAESARVEAMLMSAPKSLASQASALRCWAAFADGVLGCGGRHLPPTVEGLVAWSKIFCNRGTYCNYITAVRKACLIAGLPVWHTYDPAVKAALQAVGKRQAAPPTRRAIQHPLLQALCRLTWREGDETRP